MSDTRQHKRFGGSKCDRYMNCPGSIALGETVPERPASKYAVEGTVAHDLAEQCLRSKTHPAAFLGKEFQGVTVTLDMTDAIVTYLNEIETEMARSAGLCTVFIEQAFEIPLDSAEPGEVGSINDCVIYHPSLKRLRVFEYKHGAGVFVDVEDNKQLKFAALGAVLKNPQWQVEEIICTVVQPRARDSDQPVRDWNFDVLELLEFRAELDAAVGRAKAFAAAAQVKGFDLISSEGEPFNPGSWCRWCPAADAGVCPARDRQALQAATLDFASVVEVTADALPKPSELDVERLAAVVQGLSVLTAWANQCQEYLEAMLLAGHEVPGWKVVDKLGRAKWVEDPARVSEYAELMHGVDLTRQTLVTITEAEKILKAAGAAKDDIDAFKLQFTVKESSGRTIAPLSDRRPAIDVRASDFGSVKAIAAE
jgi:hypothetical protein